MADGAREVDGLALIAGLIAMDLRLPDHPEDRTERLAAVNAWTVGMSGLYVCTTPADAVHVARLERVVVHEASEPPDTLVSLSAFIPQWWRLLRCWKLVRSDEDRRLHRRHDWYFKIRALHHLESQTVVFGLRR
jgi:hypothetical protein